MSGLADGQDVVISELEGQFRTIFLSKSTLPKQGVEAGIKLRSVRTMYPGASTPSTQLLGTEEDDIVLEGELRDSLIGVDGAAADASVLLRSMVMGQAYCQLEWGTLLVRRGYMKAAVPKFNKEGKISYRITFEVAESDDPEVLTQAFVPVDTSQSLLEKILQAIEDVEGLAQTAILVNNVGRAVL